LSDHEDFSPEIMEENPELLEISLDKSTERLVPDPSKDFPDMEEDPFEFRRMSKLKQPDIRKYLNNNL